ncbi:scarecrow-like protein 15 [Salvia hispanica]|uniref:scarecrow-like protein 15 n=1 Tax=Salvia hispanica TaxID=49212 RepID=UPI00200946C4|nr:scarecrow-like protein 15 [Salvia hispanica]
MKLPFPTNNHSPKATSIAATVYATSPPYEPKSVLDLRGSPSPAAELENHVLITPQLEEWDSLMRELGLQDDPNPNPNPNPNSNPNLPNFPPATNAFDSSPFVSTDSGLLSDIPNYTQNPNTADVSDWNPGFDYVDELIRLAECLEMNSLQLGHVIAARLDQRLQSPSGKPLQRAAFYFKEALETLLTGSTRSPDLIQTIKAQKTFSAISPIPMFSGFTATQAVLDAVDGCAAAAVHVVDFEIGLGGHWASFIREMSEARAKPALRISALVTEEFSGESTLVRENLTQFARELNVVFEIDFVPIRNFECLYFKSVKFRDGEKVAVVLSPAIFRRVGTGFLSDLRRLAPQVVVQVDGEGLGGVSYRQAVIEGLEFYSTVMESLEAGGGGGEWMRKIEECVVYPKIEEGVVGRMGGMGWREAMEGAGLRKVGMSQFAEFQAECLVRRVQVRGFHVSKTQGEMMLCWHDRVLVATSAWRF